MNHTAIFFYNLIHRTVANTTVRHFDLVVSNGYYVYYEWFFDNLFVSMGTGASPAAGPCASRNTS